MDESLARSSCGDCGEAVELFRPACENCEATFEWDVRVACPHCEADTEIRATSCHACGEDISPWRAIERDVSATDSPASVWKDAVPRPSRDGYRRHLGSLKGQWADYRRMLDDGTEFHVLEFSDHYEIHRDEVSAIDAPAMHLVRYTPRIMMATAGGLTLGLLDTMIYSGRIMTDAMQASASAISDVEK